MTHTHNAMVRRITRAYRQASTADRATGAGWYPEAWRVGAWIAETSAGPAAWAAMTADQQHAAIARVVGVIAALSPRTQWSTNVVFAERIIAAADAGRPCPDVCIRANQATAWLIATGTAPLDALGTVSHTGRVVSGHKVRSFWANIMGDTDAVTVDMWAWAVATNGWRTHPQTGERIPADAIMTGRTYGVIADAYRRAATILGVTPRECQAAVWVAARGTKPTDAAFHARAAA